MIGSVLAPVKLAAVVQALKVATVVAGLLAGYFSHAVRQKLQLLELDRAETRMKGLIGAENLRKLTGLIQSSRLEAI